MGNTRDLSNRINESYSRLSKGQKLLATYITDNYDKAVFLTAARLGEVVGVSATKPETGRSRRCTTPRNTFPGL